MENSSKTVIVGLDGVPFDMIKNFAETGVMPNTAKLIANGYFSKMRSSIPEISSVAWSSIITGTDAGEHGIYGFMDVRPDSYSMYFPNFSDLKTQTFWEAAPGKSVIINVPATYPVRQMNGVHISGFVSIDFEKSVYPPSLSGTLKEMDYRLDVDASKAHTSMDDFLHDVDETLEARIKAYRHLWKTPDWQNFMLIFTGTDRLLHFLWSAYADKNHQHHNFIIDHFRKIDEVIGEIADNLNADDNIIILSDHGFEELETEFFVNCFLAENGFLKFNPGTDPNLSNIASGTKAFALDPGRIYINKKGKYPNGTVPADQTETIIEELTTAFDSLQINGKKAIKHIYRKEDVYSKTYLSQAPDLILIAESGINLKGAMAAKQMTAKGLFTGKHTLEDAFLLINKPASRDFFQHPPTVKLVGRYLKQITSE